MTPGGPGDDPDGRGGSGGDPPADDGSATGDDGDPFGTDREGDDARFGTGRDGDGDRPEDSAAADPDAEGEDGGWRFGLDEVDEDGIVRSTIEPGDPDPEHVAFVLLGAIAMVLVFVRLWLLVG